MVEKDAATQPEETAGQEPVEESVLEEEVEEIEEIEEVNEVEELTAEVARVKDQLLRNAAEFENFRRRMNRQRDEWPARAKAQVVRTLLPTLDDLDRTIEAADQTGEGPNALESLRSGVKLVQRNFHDALGKLGVAPIEAVGELFDENLHEAVMQAPAPDGADPNTVMHETQRGYVLGDVVLRHSQVIVSIDAQEEPVDDPAETVES